MTASTYDGRVRDRDPDTSWAAADQQSDGKTSQVVATIRVLLGSRGPLTHEELVDAYAEYGAEKPWVKTVTAQSIRTRTAEMHRRAEVRDTGQRRPTKAGGSAAVWELVPIGEEHEATA
ncbi:hypothetical protein [Curtobacterium sp. MCBA15_001]|uniref:hypothetical protein n=1 Tax=Curtobacterium sp. MCBA15_001 TaxID=1898731 RepID=UPI0008DC7ED7|nr:hypothetical protein [Curtobacterium sp. MCBA15_001]OIH95097.1 hypothetical protein BIU90_02870 [Curtobacterium sp. MCBA15_001]